MRLGILAIALSMVVLTIAAAEVKTQEAANMIGTGNPSSCPYEKIPILYPKCGNYTKYDVVTHFRLSVESSLWDRLVNKDYTKDVVETLKGMMVFGGYFLDDLTPKLYWRAMWDKNENATATSSTGSLPSDGVWIKKWDVSTPITDLLQDGNFINILLIDEFKDDESNYKCHTTQEGNTIVQAVGPLFYPDDWTTPPEWDSSEAVRNKLALNIAKKVAGKLGIHEWTSKEKRFDEFKDPCVGWMEGFEDETFSKCSNNDFERHLDSPGGRSLIRLSENTPDAWKPPIVLYFRTFVNKELLNQIQPHTLRKITVDVYNAFDKSFWDGALRPRMRVHRCGAEGITVFPCPDETGCSDMMDIEEAMKKTIGTTNINTGLNLVMLDRSTFDSISCNLPGHQEPITCDNADDISARTLVTWMEPGDTKLQDKVNDLAIILAKKLGFKDNRQSTEVIKDSKGKKCDGIMEGGTVKFSKCSNEDLDKYLDSDEGRCMRVVHNGEPVPQYAIRISCEEEPTSCKRGSNGWIVG